MKSLFSAVWNYHGTLFSAGGTFVRISTEGYGVRHRRIRLVSPNNKTPRFSLKVKGGLGESENLLFS